MLLLLVSSIHGIWYVACDETSTGVHFSTPFFYHFTSWCLYVVVDCHSVSRETVSIHFGGVTVTSVFALVFLLN